MQTIAGSNPPEATLSGTITFLFTDIEGSTRLLEKLLEAYATLLEEQRDLLRAAFAKWNGHEIDTQGDSFFVAFPRALDAVNCVIEAQRSLTAHHWPEGVDVRVRMGLHTGEPVVSRTGYIGMDVHRAARIAAAGHGGQVLVSQSTRELIYQNLPEGASLSDLGEYKLKDIRYLQRIFQLNIDGLPGDFPPLKTLSAEAPPPTPGEAPYKGLQFYSERDTEWFYGRQKVTGWLAEAVRALRAQGQRFLAVIGASGSGKSSIVRAGLVPALKGSQSGLWQIHIFTPGTHPLESMALSLTKSAGSVSVTASLMDDMQADKRSLHLFVQKMLANAVSLADHDGNGATGGQQEVLLVIDQFEEIFTQCREEAERQAFIDNLQYAVSQASGPVTVVITLRADFYEHLAQYAELREAVSKRQEYIGPMSAAELRDAIEEPARRGGWEITPGLVELMLHDIGAAEGRQPEPGALPLLSHALLETWKRRQGNLMNLRAYTEAGGVSGAIAHTAERVFNLELTAEQQGIARNIFMRLTELGEGTQDTRRRISIHELIPPGPADSAEQIQVVLMKLADARLITTGEGTVEVAHEALIREWPALREWLTADRDGLRLHRNLTEAAQDWELLDRDPGALYRGSRLLQAREWAALHPTDLNAGELAFLDASNEWEQYEAKEREAQQERELEAAQKLAETEKRSATRLRIRNRVITGVGVIALLLAVLAGVFALSSNRNAQAAQTNSVLADQQRVDAQNAQATAQVASTQAIADFTRAEAQRLAVEANNVRLNNGDPNLTALLAIRSLAMQYTPSGDAALASLTALEAPPRELKGHAKQIYGVAFSPDGKYLATASVDTTARLWDIATGQTIRVFTGHTAGLEDVAFSPDGKTLATVSHDKTIRFWDVASGQMLKVISAPNGMDSVAFSPDGRFIATTGIDPTARIWDVATGQTVHILAGHTGFTTLVAYSPDGKYVLTGSHDSTARLWDAANGKQVWVFSDHTGDVSGVAFTPDSKYAATGDEDTIRLWDVNTGQLVRSFTGHEPGTGVSGIAFSPDGKLMVSTGFDRTVRLWDVATGQFIRFFGGRSGALQAVKFSPDGRLVVTAGDDDIARIWSLQTFQGGMQFSGHSAPVREASFSPDGKWVVTASEDHTARIWDPVSGQTVMILKGHTAQVYGAVFSPDGKMVLTASGDLTARLWDAATGAEMQRFKGHTDQVNMAIFSPDGKYIVTASYDGTARVWDAQSAQTIVIYRNQGPGHVNRIAFSPDGKTVATSGDDGTAHIWDPLTGNNIMIFKGHTGPVAGVAFSPDGKYLLTSSNDSTVRLWDVASGQEVRQFAGQLGRAFGAAFSPDGKYALSTGDDGTARLWDVQTGHEVRRFVVHDIMRSAVFSPDGKYILTSSHDNTARLWLTDLHDTIRAVCAMLTRDLTPEERIQFEISDQSPTCPRQ